MNKLDERVKYKGKGFVVFTAYLYLVLGVLFLIKPSGMSSGLGFVDLSESALTEVMASYGGLWTGIGLLLLYLQRKGELRIALLVVLLTFAGFAFGRVFGAIRYGGFYGLNLYWWASEIIYIGIAVYYLRFYNKREEKAG